MLYVSSVILKTWQPRLQRPSSAGVRWTSVTAQGVQITNSLEEAVWTGSLPQVHICPQCGMYGCYDGGYARLTCLSQHLLWTAPYADPESPGELDLDSAAEVVYEHASVAIPFEVWESWRRKVPSLPEASAFPAAQRRDLAAAWRLEAPAGLRELPLDGLLERLKPRLLVTDALAQVHALLDWFLEAPDQPAAGRLAASAEAGAQVETLYFDAAPREAAQEWSALVRRGADWLPAFGRFWYFQPDGA